MGLSGGLLAALKAAAWAAIKWLHAKWSGAEQARQERAGEIRKLAAETSAENERIRAKGVDLRNRYNSVFAMMGIFQGSAHIQKVERLDLDLANAERHSTQAATADAAARSQELDLSEPLAQIRHAGAQLTVIREYLDAELKELEATRLRHLQRMH